MIELGVFHNGASDLPVTITADGVAINAGNLRTTQEAAVRTQIDQIRQGVLAEQLGFDYFFLTEHHFQPEGAEDSPNPIQTQTAIAALTKRIRLGQTANILTWHHPVRLAEQAAILDVVSGGRLEFGLGRGYQPRETEVLGGPLGATIQDQERNRAYFEEAYEIIMKCWTQESFSHHGEFFTIPPSYTRWNHKQTIAYFNEPGNGRDLEDVIAIGGPDMYSAGSPVLATTTKLLELQVYPQPVQKPYPQMWQPLTSPRSIEFAAQHGVNGYFIVEPNNRLKQNIETYYAAAEKAGYPDRLDRGEFKYGWDASSHRGIITGRYIHITDHGIGDMDKAARALEVQWDYYGPFGFAGVLAEPGETVDIGRKVTAEELRQRGVAIHGSVDQVIEEIMKIKTVCGYDDFMLNTWFELGGFAGSQVEDQMRCFAEEVMPVLERECGGRAEFPESDVSLVPGARSRFRREEEITMSTTTKQATSPSLESAALAELYTTWVERMAAAPDMDLPTLRSMFEEWHLPTAEPEGVHYRHVDAGGVPAMWCTPDGAATDRAIIWTHGGGYVVGSMHSHRKVAGHLAKAAGVPVLVLDYRRAPEHPHPAQVEDAVAAYRWLLADQGLAPEHIATTGDSAGGGLCTSMVLALRDAGDPLPAAVMPLSPFYDMEATGDSVTTNAEADALVQREILLAMAGMFLGDASPRDPLANPLHADPAGLPPMLIQVGGAETLLDDSTRFAARAEAAGVDCTVEVYPDMQHVFQFLAGRAPEADDAIAAMAAWVRPKLGL